MVGGTGDPVLRNGGDTVEGRPLWRENRFDIVDFVNPSGGALVPPLTDSLLPGHALGGVRR